GRRGSGSPTDRSAAGVEQVSVSLPGPQAHSRGTVNGTDASGALAVSRSRLTDASREPAPAPAPDPACTRPGNACNTPAAVNSDSQKWLPSTSATTPSTTTIDKHTNSGHHSK